jgi:hypothetical protein
MSTLTAADQDLVGAVFIAQLGRVALARLELDGDLGVVEQVGALEDDAEAALAVVEPSCQSIVLCLSHAMPCNAMPSPPIGGTGGVCLPPSKNKVRTG